MAREQDNGQHCSQEEKSNGYQKYPVGMQEAFLTYLERQSRTDDDITVFARIVEESDN